MNTFNINSTPILVGTSGYSFNDWMGTFYPEDTSPKGLLEFYTNTGFNFLELTYTFYKMPLASRMEEMLRKTEGKINFSVRIPKELIRYNVEEGLLEEFLAGLKPLHDAGKLVSIFADFHPSFVSKKTNLEHIFRMKDKFGELPLFVELNNVSWYKERYTEELKNNEVGMIALDMPKGKGFPPLYPVVSQGVLYIRMFGRSKKWINMDDKYYNYSYSDQEIKGMLELINNKAVTAKKVFISFCNVHNGVAPENAQRCIELAAQGINNFVPPSVAMRNKQNKQNN